MRRCLKKHLRTIIEITCAVLAAVVIIPLAVQVNRLAANTVSGTSGSVQNGDPQSASFGGSVDLDKEGFSKPLYSCLSGNDKALYSMIYSGIRSLEEKITTQSLVYKISDVADIFDDVINDNPALNNTQGYTLDYYDDNANGQPDPEEGVFSVIPNYTGISRNEAGEYIDKILAETYLDENDPIECLRYLHDKIILKNDLPARNSTPTASTSHGALIEHKADEPGIARALCDYAQRLGFFCFVADTTVAGTTMNMPLVRIMVDERFVKTRGSITKRCPVRSKN